VFRPNTVSEVIVFFLEKFPKKKREDFKGIKKKSTKYQNELAGLRRQSALSFTMCIKGLHCWT
jgi:hypothetical protein